MKLHLPVLLRKALLACFSFSFACSEVTSAADLTLGGDASLTIDYAAANSIPDLAGGTLQLSGDTILLLSNCGVGDGKTYTLLTGVGALLDAEGNPLTLTDVNNAASLYFDTSRPGAGFWADGWLQLASDGSVQIVLHAEDVQEALTITTRQTGSKTYNYYEDICFRDITHSPNSSTAWGGAICGDGDSTITLSNNGSVVFEGNTASSLDSAWGGAIYGGISSTITLSNNGSVVFEGNTAFNSTDDASGGAIYGDTITLSNNGSVVFVGNTASSGSFIAGGGAIYGYGSITIDNNGSVVFVGNTASSGSSIVGAGGGAIRVSGESNELFITGNALGQNEDGSAQQLLFENNHTKSTGDLLLSLGGAIYAGDGSTLKIDNNGETIFRGNYASSTRSDANGGAIYNRNRIFSIQNNTSVVFEKNYTLQRGTLRLQGIYANDLGGSGGEMVVNFSAPKDGKIEFRDSIHIDMDSHSASAFHLNNWYENDVGAKIAQTGDIIFTGADATAENLKAILAAHGINREATADEIRLSKTSEVGGTMQLHDGRLIIRGGAVLKAEGIKVFSSISEKSTPTLWLDNGELTYYQSRNALSFASGTAFALSRQNAVRNTTITFEGGSSFIITLDATHAATAALTLTNSTLTLPTTGTLTLQLNAGETLFSENSYKLLSGIAKPSDWDEKSITVTSGTDGWTVSFDDLEWIGDTLWLNNNIEITPNVPPAPAPEFNPNLDRNQQEVYDTMKDIMAGGNPGGVLGLLGQNIVGSRDEAELKRALDEISGREYATIMSSQVEGNLGHLRRLRAAAGMGTPLGEYVTFSCCYPSNKGVDKSNNKGATVMMAPSPVLDSRRIRAGVSAFHEQGEIESDSNGDGFERSETGAQLTMEYLVGNDFVLGMGLSHSRTKLTPAYGKRRDEDNTHVDLYGVYQGGSWSSTTALGVGLHQHELGRTVAGMQTEAEADGLSVNFLQELAYCVYADEEQGLEVFGAVESSFNKVDSFSESGAGNASLLVDEQDAWATDVTLGLRYNHALPSLGKAPAGVFTLQGGVVASLGDTNADATVHFAGASGYAFKQSAAERNRWGYSVGASVNLPVSASTAVFGTAEAVLRNDSYTVDAQVGVKMAF